METTMRVPPPGGPATGWRGVGGPEVAPFRVEEGQSFPAVMEPSREEARARLAARVVVPGDRGRE